MCTPRTTKFEQIFNFSRPGMECENMIGRGKDIILGLYIWFGRLPRWNAFMQVVGIEGHNPSGHCLIASKVVDSIPLSAAADVNLPPKKKQALDQEMQLSDLSCTQEELTVVHLFCLHHLMKCALAK